MPDAIEPTRVDWTCRASIELRDCDLTAPWILLAELVEDATLLKISASGTWNPLPVAGVTCGPDGLAGLRIQADALILADAPLGALIGKIGGGSATAAGAAAAGAGAMGLGLDGKPFGIGTCCILQIPRQALGPVFVGLNVTARPVALNALAVRLDTAMVNGATVTSQDGH